MLEFSHKILNETIYQVVNDDTGQTSEPKDATNSKGRARLESQRIKIHSNPFFIDRGNHYQKKFQETFGRSEMIHSICDDISDYINN